MTDVSVELRDELRAFLSSVKVAETVSDALRGAISVPTGLEEALQTAVAAGSDVLVAGSAGGGKTHLLHALEDEFLTCLWTDESMPTEPFVQIIPDATVVFERIVSGELEARSEHCLSRVIAINEGPLLALARHRVDSSFAKGVPILHAAQRGLVRPHVEDAPVVIDVGGYDPIENEVVGRLLALPLLRDLVLNSACSCDDATICPRKLAWRQLESEEVRDRVNDVLRLANVAGRSILFRDVWDFIADLALRGSCETDPPTSPWFWRVFHGDSVLADHLRAVADPSLVVYPRAEAHLWWGDWTADEIELLEGIELVPLFTDPPFENSRYAWLKAQFFFIVEAQSVLAIVRDQVNLEMLSSLDRNQVGDIVATLNSYMSYGTRPPLSQRLELWMDMGVERRMDRARGQASLGRVATSELQIVRSASVANHPNPEIVVPGSRAYLAHQRSGASLSLTLDALSLLREGRSFRISDRPHTDMEWQVTDFYATIGREEAAPDRLAVLELEFDTMSGSLRSYLIAPDANYIELADD